MLLTQAARALGLQERFDEATELLDRLSSSDPNPPEVVVRLLLERGRVANSRGDPPGARPLFGRASDAGHWTGRGSILAAAYPAQQDPRTV